MANRLSELRKRNKLTQKEFAKIIGVTPVSVSRWENGDHGLNDKQITKIANYFNVTPAYLLGYDDNNNSINNHAPNFQNSGGGDITINNQSENHVEKLIEYGNKLDRILKNQDETITLLKQIYNELIALKTDASTNQQKNIDRLLTMLDKTLTE